MRLSNNMLFIRAFLSRCDRPNVAFDITRVEITEHGLLGVAVLCGLNLGQALKIVLKFSKLQSNLLDISINDHEEKTTITMRPNYQMEDAVYQFTMELTLGTFFKSKQDLTGLITHDHVIRVNYSPGNKALAFQEFFGGIIFDADTVSFSFPASQLKAITAC